MNQSLEEIQEVLGRVRAEIAKVIIGQESLMEHCLIAILCRNHVLMEGVPGVGKTLLVRTLGKVLGTECGRIQFTPDLMPADITGTSVFDLKENQFRLVKGPVFTGFLLADEINRAPAKTQSALLQAMQERCVSIDNETHLLPPNFTVFATQNPVEFEGTYPLPEAQKDRFLFKLSVGYPSRDEEVSLARRLLQGDSPETVLEGGAVQPVLLADKISAVVRAIGGVTVREELMQYAVELVRATREHEAVLVGAGPRAVMGLVLASRARSVLQQRDYVTPDDIRALTAPVLGHRIVLRPEYEIEGFTIDELLQGILNRVTVPR